MRNAELQTKAATIRSPAGSDGWRTPRNIVRYCLLARNRSHSYTGLLKPDLSGLAESVIVSRKIQGQVITVTDQGNLLTDITAEQLSSVPEDLRVRVTCDEHFTQGIFRSGHNEPDFTFLPVLGIGGGERVIVEWE